MAWGLPVSWNISIIRQDVEVSKEGIYGSHHGPASGQASAGVPTGLEGPGFLRPETPSPPPLITDGTEVQTRHVHFSLPQALVSSYPGKGGPRAWDGGPQRGLHRRAVEPEEKKAGSGRPREEKTQAGGVGRGKLKT